MKTIEEIDGVVIKEFCDRKYKGRIDFVVDVKTGKFYPVPRSIEHKDFIPSISPSFNGENLIPSQLRLNFNTHSGRYDLLEVIVGASSYEATTGTCHYRKDLVTAFNLTWELINRSQMINPATVSRNDILHTYKKE